MHFVKVLLFYAHKSSLLFLKLVMCLFWCHVISIFEKAAKKFIEKIIFFQIKFTQ